MFRRTAEFNHYDGCGHNDPDNCSGCALTDLRQDSPNYSGWPLVYMENGRTIPAKWKSAFFDELTSDNKAYAANLVKHVQECRVRFSDGTSAKVVNGLVVHA